MIEAAHAPSRLLDCYVWLIIGSSLGKPYQARGSDPVLPAEIVQGRWFGSALAKYPLDVEGVASNWRVPKFTLSIDAARLLLQKVGFVLNSPLGEKPTVSTKAAIGWSMPNAGVNEAMAMTVAGLRSASPSQRSHHA
ncbi:hypothetical protein [Sphingomonas sp. 3-13AW]|uniref:hypothetical protein n=1 Tax=Sphingomonas sp. 3-13AW TaxID=3050450 RepID=UPI003BB77C20